MTDSHPLRNSLFEQLSELIDGSKDDLTLHQAVEELCAAHPEHGDALRAELKRVLERDGAASARPSRAPAGTPTQIGPYRLLDELGEGGMGTVYLAEQDRPLKRRVALKLIKLGMDSKAVVARFEQERQALALMDHEAIAKVFDCGTSERGQPFFVMELVKGAPLDKFCEQNKLALTDRLLLMKQVCAAVQHAHQKGIVHRDLKPGNVLVSNHSGRLQVKIIDFGLAKAMGQKLVEATLFTEVGQIVGTPEYMAPEQADPSNEDIDTRADIYSLGVMLYQVLVGELPFSSADLRKAGILEIQRVLREVDPPKPSTKLTTIGDAATELARTRRVSVGALKRALKTDLDWVVLKALEKDRNRRYDTANALSADLQRYMDHEPLIAGPPSAGYRLRKLARRYRGQLITCAAVLLTAIAGAVIAVDYAVAASESARLAKRRADESIVARRAATKSAGAAKDRADEAEAVVAFVEAIFGRLADSSVNAMDLRVRDLVEVASTVTPPSESSLAYMRTQGLMGSLLMSSNDYPAASDRFADVAEIMLALEERSRSDPSFRGNPASFHNSATIALQKAASLALKHAWATRDTNKVPRAVELHARVVKLGKIVDEVTAAEFAFDEVLLAELGGDSARAQNLLDGLRPKLLVWLNSEDDAESRLAQVQLVSASALYSTWDEHAAGAECIDAVLEPEVRSSLAASIESQALRNRLIVNAKTAAPEELAGWAKAYLEFVDSTFAIDNPTLIGELPGVWDTLVNRGVHSPPSSVPPLDRFHACARNSPLAARAKYLGSLAMAALVRGDASLTLDVATAMADLSSDLAPEHGPQFILALGAAVKILQGSGDFARIAALFRSAGGKLGEFDGGDYEEIRPLLLAKGVLALAHQRDAAGVDAAIKTHAADLASVPKESLEQTYQQAYAAASDDAARALLKAARRKLNSSAGR